MAKQRQVNRENYIVIQGWMITDLNLKGNELIIYACIYGFSQAEEQAFSGGLQYLADWANITKQSVRNALKSLIEKGYVKKEDYFTNGVNFVKYYSTNFTGGQKILPGVKKFYRGSKNFTEAQKSLPNNIINKEVSTTNILDTTKELNTTKELSIVDLPKEKQFKVPTVEEVAAYCSERKNNVDPQKFVDYYTSNGWKVGKNKMKDWKAAVRTWERNNFGKNGGKTYGSTGVEIRHPEVDDLAAIF